MYLLNAENKITWVLGVTVNTILFSDFDIVLVNPLGEITYITAPLLVENFVAPTELSEGMVSYFFVPDTEGCWKINLVKGTASNYRVLSKLKMHVLNNSISIGPINVPG